MTDWVNIANSAVAPKAPVTSELVTALRDNTVVSTWEFYETVYDAALDGSVSLITTPNFEDGWEYGFRAESLGHSSGGSYAAGIDAYDETNNAWFPFTSTLYGISSSDAFSLLPMSAPMLPRIPQTRLRTYEAQVFRRDSDGSGSVGFENIISNGALDRVWRNFRFSLTNGTTYGVVPITKGKVLMYRRKENISDA